MNSRVLELLKDPKNIQPEDIQLLKGEIDSFPYIQNIRALHLYGVHLFDQENYQKELSVTAAYTTEKKILYQLINGKIPEIQKPVIIEQEKKAVIEPVPIQEEEPLAEKTPTQEDQKQIPIHNIPPQNKLIYVNGERNRILFEGEENFLEEDHSETIDLESTLESGVIVTQKKEKEVIEDEEKAIVENQQEITNEVEEEVTPEVIINEEEISTEAEKTEINDGSELSFHGTDSFLPDVKIQTTNETESMQSEISQPNVNKHEEEMRRLIDEVEKKMKMSKGSISEKEREKEESESHEISFADTQSFHVETLRPSEKPKVDIQPDNKISDRGNESKSDEIKEIELIEEDKGKLSDTQEVKSTWKPMVLESNIPDSFINKIEMPVPVQEKEKETQLKEAPEAEQKEALSKISQKEEPVAEVNEEKEEENVIEVEETDVPVMNVSFFGSDISSLRINKEEEKEQPEETKQHAATEPISSDSNIPGFINTWQSWLKIDRTEEIEKEKAQNKIKAIDSFIENNPKITQLKDENNYVVKEKTDDISHLMTETLANLYLEQKLYTKATNAFHILVKKYPERKDYFEGKIQEIKTIRGGNKE
ncbi:hypothetical protein [Chryseobacterium sp.]|uniref:hypothetical protein n=1 Tax=Chryseobacterium sp. TaxID=1871047 RepID=UPI0025C25DFA|nr:hypothetical protein [Chryseobacterium sp.]